ncbi:2C-methyl-D-erythritol 2,4-cyclodiphosphate synthase [plant metagenome]|uniref:2C-methyl-D-erythritol 2,4-cyclodiphosphate synthase n=1 Tax=plant metagenome TaxID=1297885 RepID=A0A484S9Y7_9ZZZZ
MNWGGYTYQARITGFPFDTMGCRWSDEWLWMGVHFDGFVATECLLQEAKGRYDQFVDSNGKVHGWFAGYEELEVEASRQAGVIHQSLPARLRWYFQTPKMMGAMAPLLAALKIETMYVP